MSVSAGMDPIVVVEDPFIFNFLRTVLARKGYPVIRMNAENGVDLLRSGNSRVGMVITNLPEAFQEFGERIPLLYLAALPDPGATATFRASQVLRKPFLPNQLLSCVEQLLPAGVR